ncbi:helix-turn-helix transcriptional regulator [Streptomyces sp. 7R007]
MGGDDLAFPWARTYDADQLAAFIDDLWGAAGGGDDLATLDAIEKVIAEHRPERDASDERGAPPCPLSPWHLRLLTRIANGDTHVDAARKLGIKTNTIRVAVSRIYERIGARNAAHAVVIALSRGWLPAESIELPLPQETERRSPSAWKRLYRQCAADLRATPGAWRAISAYQSRDGARRAADRMCKGLMDDFEPAGAFEATASVENGQWVVRARYIGIPNQPAEKAS